MFIEIISVNKKKETDVLTSRADELKQKLDKYGYKLNAIHKTLLNPVTINSTLNNLAGAEEKPDVVIIANALRTKDSTSFKNYFVETVVTAERAESEPAPKDYWKKRNKAFAEAKKNKAGEEELKKLEEEFTLTRKMAKVFSLGDFGNGFKGYCFIYKGIRVAAVPKAELTEADFAEIAALAAVRTTEVFENSANDYPDGFTVEHYIPPKTDFVSKYIPQKGDSKN